MATADEEDIATAMLLGCDPTFSGELWYVGPTDAPPHPIERANDRATGFNGFVKRADLARAWIKYTLERLNGEEDGASD